MRFITKSVKWDFVANLFRLKKVGLRNLSSIITPSIQGWCPAMLVKAFILFFSDGSILFLGDNKETPLLTIISCMLQWCQLETQENDGNCSHVHLGIFVWVPSILNSYSILGVFAGMTIKDKIEREKKN